MSLPGTVRAEVTEALRTLAGTDASIEAVTPVRGGCINHGARVETPGGSYFLKWNASAPRGMFEAEEDGLRALHAAAHRVPPEVRPRVPLPLARSDAPHRADAAWLLTEWLEPGPSAEDSAALLGRGLALLHEAGSGEAGLRTQGDGADHFFGWERDNWIGSLPQANEPLASWSGFWTERRIVPQLELARRGGFLRDGSMDDLLAVIPAALDGVTEASLLHGDLWSGNSYVTDDGRSALVDPAVYLGDGEVDLAMTELFGGFGAGFYDAYDDVRPISAEYRSHRRALYQLYYLLVHVNLFGGGYEAGCRRAAETVVSAVR